MGKKSIWVLCLIGYQILQSQPQVSLGTGIISFNLNSFGRISTGSYPYITSNREIDKMTLFVGQSETAVFDYYNDADTTTYTARKIIIAGADSSAEVLSDNGYSNLPPKIKIRTAIMEWKNQKYFIVRYRVIADTNSLGSLFYGTAIIPRVGTLIGSETIKYNVSKNITYFYREGTASFWGIKLLNQNPYGVTILDWNKYSSNPNIEPVKDSIRFAMINKNQFDSSFVAGTNGSIFSVNAGSSFFSKRGDSVTVYYAIGFGNSEAELYASLDSATVKFPKIVTTINSELNFVPINFTLDQNYPNPFNPSTTISYQLPVTNLVSLKVYDALGREVAILVDEVKEAGRYVAQFDGSKLSSGIYLYRMRTGNFVDTKRLVLLK